MISRASIAIVLLLSLPSLQAGERFYCLTYTHPLNGRLVIATLSMITNQVFPYLLTSADKTTMFIKSIDLNVVGGGFGGFFYRNDDAGFL